MPRSRLIVLLLLCFLGASHSSFAKDDDARELRMPSQTIEVQSNGTTESERASPTNRDPLQNRLPSRSKSSAENAGAKSTRRSSSALTVTSSLAVVVGVFLLVVWVSRRAAPKSSQALPADVVQILGRAPLAPRNVMQLVRIGKKLLLISLTAQGATTLAEITDPQEVDRLAALCERARPGSISSTFRNVLHQFGEERSVSGFIGRERGADRQSA